MSGSLIRTLIYKIIFVLPYSVGLFLPQIAFFMIVKWQKFQLLQLHITYFREIEIIYIPEWPEIFSDCISLDHMLMNELIIVRRGWNAMISSD